MGRDRPIGMVPSENLVEVRTAPALSQSPDAVVPDRIPSVAIAVAMARGVPPASATAMMADPRQSPFMTDPLWIALGTAANEVAVALTLLFWILVLRPSRSVVLPLRRTSAAAILAALL